MATFNGVSYTFASFAPYAYATIWDQFWTDVLAEFDDRANGMGAALPVFVTGWDAGTADANPGIGKLRGNAATLAASTQLFISTTDGVGSDVSAVIGLFDDSTSTPKGLLRIGHRSDQTKWALFTVTGAVTAAGGYGKVPVSFVAGPGGFAAGDPLTLGFVPKGDAGQAGGAALPAGTVAAPGLAVTGDANTGLAQVGGAGSLSIVGGGKEVFRASPNATKVFGAVTVGDRGDGFGSALTLTPGAGPDWHLYSRVSDGALVFYHFKDRLGATVSTEAMVLKDGGTVDFAVPPTVNGNPISSGLRAVSKSTNYTITSSDGGSVIKAMSAINLTLPAASSLQSNWWVTLSNRSIGTVQIVRTGSDTINGLAGGFAVRSGEDITVYRSGASAFDLLTLGRSVTEGQGTWNPSAKGVGITLSNNNLTAAADQNLNTSVRANAGASSGKRYFEMVMNSANGVIAGLMNTSGNLNGQFPQDSNGWAYYHDGRRGTGGSSGAYGSSLSNGSVLRVAVDLDAGKLFFGIGSVWQGSADPVTGTNPALTGVFGTLYPAFSRDGTGTPVSTLIMNLSSFNYAPPTGYSTF